MLEFENIIDQRIFGFHLSATAGRIVDDDDAPGLSATAYLYDIFPRHLRHDYANNRKPHRERELYTMGFARLASRARRFHRTTWWAERRAELNKLIWTTCPVCCNLRAGVF